MKAAIARSCSRSAANRREPTSNWNLTSPIATPSTTSGPGMKVVWEVRKLGVGGAERSGVGGGVKEILS